MMKADKTTIIRTIILFVSLINVILQMFGIKTLPIDNELITEAVSVVFLLCSAVSSWWHNNSFTEKACLADDYLKELKKNETE
ncbi:MAG: phage holin [Acetobacter sp.]|nr:phage holin [Bacteroides sp.]MCM1340462.1 phage holin [Acetobacter sp.]MCM1433202.1 phage holin [Clostridiales bacterium]